MKKVSDRIGAYLAGEYSQFQKTSQPPKVPSTRNVREMQGKFGWRERRLATVRDHCRMREKATSIKPVPAR